MTITSVSESAILLATAPTVWNIIRGFDGVARWDPFVRDCVIEDAWPGDRVGAVRRIHLQDGTALRERLTALSDKDMSYSFSVVESPLAFTYHSSTVSLLPVEGGTKTVMTWEVAFGLSAGDADGVAAEIRQGLIMQGFTHLAELVAAVRNPSRGSS
jgi:hypothetical protein